MYTRFIEDHLKKTTMPVVLLNGARQVGKSTLVRKIFSNTHRYLTLDDPQMLSIIQKDPLNFIRLSKEPLIIDEVQRCPDLFLAIKMLVDDKRIPQQFILTGSVNVLRLKDVKDSLAGRMIIYTLWPLSQDEILGQPSCFLDHLFNQSISGRSFYISDLNERVQKGGYPLSVLYDTPQERQQWFQSYLEQILSKDIRDLSNIEGLKDIPNILNLLATRVGGLLNVTDLSRSLGVPHTTLKRYLSLLDMAYLFCPVPPWFQNIGKRLSKSDKVFLNDTALIESILHRDTSSDPNLFDHVLENFVMNELSKQISYHHTPLRLFHYRTLSGQEIDFIVEKSNGDIVGIEVKAASRFSHKDITSLISMKQHPQFKAGVILYRGTEILPIDEHIYAVPLSYLWTAQN